MYLKSTREHNNGDISGYLHIWHNNDWKKVCNSDWGITESHVVCRQLGLTAATYMHGPVSDKSTYRDVKSRVKCIGTENRLDECEVGEWNNENCQNPVFVACAKTIPGNNISLIMTFIIL